MWFLRIRTDGVAKPLAALALIWVAMFVILPALRYAGHIIFL